MANHEENIESSILLDIFPEEIWMLIFQKIFHPEHLLHLRKSSEFFRILLETQKTKFLFPDVIKILCPRLANLYINMGTHGKTSSHLLKCRLVCRTWQLGVDANLQNSNTFCGMADIDRELGWKPKPTDTTFCRLDKPVAFLQRFDKNYATTNRNPFLSKSVFIEYNQGINENDLESYTHQLFQILSTYGHDIWSFSMLLGFTWHSTIVSTVWPYKTLHNFLKLMPNLKTLRFSSMGIFPDSQTLEVSMKNCVFPKLKNLRHLHMSNVPASVFRALLRRYAHVNMLSIYAIPFSTFLMMNRYPMPNLKHIGCCLDDLNKLTQGNIRALQQLQTLAITFTSIQIDWNYWFKILENIWADTLTGLKIDLFPAGFENSFRDGVMPKLKLPNLKEFRIHSRRFVPLDFVLPMRNSLERLVVQYYPNPMLRADELEFEFENEGTIKFFKFRKNIRDSNIWELFPKLRTVEYVEYSRGQVYSRPLIN